MLPSGGFRVCHLYRIFNILLKRRRGDIDVMHIVTSINYLIMVTYVLADVVLGSLAYDSSRDNNCQCSDRWLELIEFTSVQGVRASHTELGDLEL